MGSVVNPSAKLGTMEWPLILLPLLSLIHTGWSVDCFACSGNCYTSQCNCQTGTCEGQFCFSRRGHDAMRGYWVSKGCTNRLPSSTPGCFYEPEYPDASCYCNEDFCNEYIEEPQLADLPVMRCHQCDDVKKNDKCGGDCTNANFCAISTRDRRSYCGNGAPRFPFMYDADSMVEQTVSGGICVAQQLGTEMVLNTCVCATSDCNHRGLVDQVPMEYAKSLLMCRACKDSGGSFSLNQCGETCLGHFCTISVRSVMGVVSGKTYHWAAGCLNTTHPSLVQRGCYREWMTDIEETISCACASGHFCNRNLGQAGREGSASGTVPQLILLALLQLMLFCPTL